MAADLKIGGFNGTWGQGAAIDRKRALLQKEGVQFEASGDKIAAVSLHRFGTENKRKRREDDS